MTLRPPRDEDFDAMLALIRDAQQASYGVGDATAEELRTWLTTPSVDPARDVRVLEDGGRLVGYVDADCTGDDPKRWWSDINVAPDADVETVLPRLLEWLEERAGEGFLRVWTGADNSRMLDAYERLGFEPVRHSYRMGITLDADLPEPSWPDGIAVRTYAPEDERRLYDAHVEVWQDASDPLEETFEEWQHWMTKRATFDASLWFLAEDGSELAGFSLCSIEEADPDAGWVGNLGVRRPWRRNGLGEALLHHSFREFAARGLTSAKLGVDASSPTGATRLYERAGMSIYRDTVFLERPVCV